MSALFDEDAAFAESWLRSLRDRMPAGSFTFDSDGFIRPVEDSAAPPASSTPPPPPPAPTGVREATPHVPAPPVALARQSGSSDAVGPYSTGAAGAGANTSAPAAAAAAADAAAAATAPDAGLRAITLEELGRHDTDTDCWVAVGGRVYDLTAFLPSHPGGGWLVVQHAGRDATDAFASAHQNSGAGLLDKFAPIGLLKN